MTLVDLKVMPETLLEAERENQKTKLMDDGGGTDQKPFPVVDEAFRKIYPRSTAVVERMKVVNFRPSLAGRRWQPFVSREMRTWPWEFLLLRYSKIWG